MVNYKLLKKCDLKAWNKILDDNINKDNSDLGDLINNNEIISDTEEEFIIENKMEYVWD